MATHNIFMGWPRFSYRLILLPSFAGLACCACKSPANVSADTPANSPHVAQESSAASIATSEAIAKPTARTITPPAFDLTASAAAYQEGINLASSAHTLSQSALSPDDWGLIASRWERAATQLKKVVPQDDRYEKAQQKADEYTRNANAANTQIAQLRSPVYIPLPAQSAAPQPSRQAASRQTTADRSQQAPPNTTRIPIVRRMHGTPIVQVTFNRSNTYEMILDTGASRTLITRQMARELGVVTTERMMATTASQAEVSFDVGQVSAISMGDVTIANTPVTIGDAVNIGLLGNDFLQGYDVTIRANIGFVELTRSN